jgi:RNA:NAD 2'-phosphotransferase (TPT1/KptA family)
MKRRVVHLAAALTAAAAAARRRARKDDIFLRHGVFSIKSCFTVQ